MTLYQRIDEFTDAVKEIAEGVSAYLYGSVMFDDYREGLSDVDVLFLTQYPLSDVQTEKLLSLRQKLNEKYETTLFDEFEGAVLSAEAFVNGTPTTVVVYEKGKQQKKATYPFDAVGILLLKSGKRLCGKDVLQDLPVPTKEDVAACVRRFAENFAPEKYSDVPSAMFALARQMYVLSTQKVCGKSDAMLWAMEKGLVDEKVGMQCLALRMTGSAKGNQTVQKWLTSDKLKKDCEKLYAKLRKVTGE